MKEASIAKIDPITHEGAIVQAINVGQDGEALSSNMAEARGLVTLFPVFLDNATHAMVAKIQNV
jgi:hypothetical protein